jgi:uncharacterized membrane protein required for colicin V production
MFDLVDILFIVTIVLLVFNGLRNGAVFSLFNLLSLPAGFIVAKVYGPQFTALLAANNLSVTPLIAYIVLFFATVLVIHIIGTVVRGFVRKLPLIGFGDALLGGVIGFIEAWLLWVVLLIVLQNFLQDTHLIPGISASQFQSWQQFYNTAVTNSLFAKVNGFFVKTIPIHF